MSWPWFYSESCSDYVAVGSTVTGNNKLFWVVSLKNLDSSGETLARTYTQSRHAKSTIERLPLNRNWPLTGLFSSNCTVANILEPPNFFKLTLSWIWLLVLNLDHFHGKMQSFISFLYLKISWKILTCSTCVFCINKILSKDYSNMNEENWEG